MTHSMPVSRINSAVSSQAGSQDCVPSHQSLMRMNLGNLNPRPWQVSAWSLSQLSVEIGRVQEKQMTRGLPAGCPGNVGCRARKEGQRGRGMETEGSVDLEPVLLWGQS